MRKKENNEENVSGSFIDNDPSRQAASIMEFLYVGPIERRPNMIHPIVRSLHHSRRSVTYVIHYVPNLAQSLRRDNV